jgi:hypothetical protein
MPSVVISAVITAIRQKADMENTSFVTDAELVTKLNSAWQKLYGIIVSANKNYYLSSASVPTVNGQADYALPVGLWKVLGVDYVRGAMDICTLDAWTFEDRNKIRQGWSQSPKHYILKESTLQLIPIPDTSGTSIIIYYAPEPVAITATNQVLAVPPYGEEWLACRVALECLGKEESDTSVVGLQLQDAERFMIDQLPNRDQGNPARVNDVHSRNQSDLYGWIR